jgi:hypothetical protein
MICTCQVGQRLLTVDVDITPCFALSCHELGIYRFVEISKVSTCNIFWRMINLSRLVPFWAHTCSRSGEPMEIQWCIFGYHWNELNTSQITITSKDRHYYGL